MIGRRRNERRQGEDRLADGSGWPRLTVIGVLTLCAVLFPLALAGSLLLVVPR